MHLKFNSLELQQINHIFREIIFYLKFNYVCVATSAHFSTGYSMGFLSPGIPLLRKQHIPDLTDDQVGNLGSLLLLSATLINPISAILADSRIGRKGTLILTAIPFIVSYTLNICFPSSITAHYISRLAAGWSI
jgi:MFS family permease